MSTLQELLRNSAKQLQEELVAHRRYFHQHAETHTDLPLTTAYVKEQLTAMGYAPIDCGTCGIVAIAGGKKPGKVFLIRGDMDALPITEECDLPFKSENGNMHACGHDFHTAMLLGAAKLLKAHETEIEGTVKLMFQPAEETLKGAKLMIDGGVLENPAVDAALMMHVASGMPFPSGSVVLPNPGAGSSASDWFEINIQGKGGHGASPETTIDPINIAVHIHMAIQALNSREISANDSAVFTICKMAAGTTSNVIPDTAHMAGTIRTFSPQMREFIPKRMAEIAENTAKAFRGEAALTLLPGCPSIVNDKDLIATVKIGMRELLPAEQVYAMDEIMPGGKMMGSEDFGYVSEKVPTIMLGLAAGRPQDGYTYPAHHPKSCFDEAALSNGAAIYAYSAIYWLKHHQ